MNRTELKGNWKQVRGLAKEEWGRLTDDDLAQIEGRVEALVGKVQERYGKTAAAASSEIDEWLSRVPS